MYCIYPWECVGGGACVCMYVFTLWHKDTQRSAGKSQWIQYVYIRTPGAHTVHMYPCGVLWNTCTLCWAAHTADCHWNPFVSSDGWILLIFFLVWIPNCCMNSALNRTELKRDWKPHRVQLTEAVDLAEMVTQLNFHGDASEKCCLGLIDYENHWIQPFSWGLCYKLSKDGLSETFVPIQPGLVPHCSLHTFMMRGALGGPP